MSHGHGRKHLSHPKGYDWRNHADSHMGGEALNNSKTAIPCSIKGLGMDMPPQ